MRIMFDNKYGDATVLEIDNIGMADYDGLYLYFSKETLSFENPPARVRTDCRYKISDKECGRNILTRLLENGYTKLGNTIEMYDTDKKRYINL